MPSVSLEVPVAGSVLLATHVNNYAALQSAINALDANNWASGKIFAPSKLTQEGATTGQAIVWNGTQWAPAAAGPALITDSGFLGAAQANFDFTSIVTTYNHLRLVVYARGDTAAALTSVNLRLNNDSAGNYDYQYVSGTGGTAGATEGFAGVQLYVGDMPANTAGANLFSYAVIDIPFYQSANNKVTQARFSHKRGTATTNMLEELFSGFWRSNSVINRITLLPGAGNFQIGSRAMLYGIV